MLRRLGLLLVTTLVLVGMATESASAETRRLRDRPDNAPALIDITRATLTNAQDYLKMTVHARNLSGRAGLVVTIDTGNRGGRGYLLQSFGTDDGYYNTLYRFRRPNGRYTPIECDGLSGRQWNGAKSRFRVSVPQRCFGRDAGALRLTVTLQKAQSQRRDTLRPSPVRLRRS
jgi:hypothetical protein